MMNSNKYIDYSKEPGKYVSSVNLSYNDIPLVSVVTDNFDSHNICYIRQLYNSLLNQTFSFWEWIIIESNELDIKEEIMSLDIKDSRIKIINNKDNNSFVNYITSALCNTKGNIVLLLDAYDLLDKTLLECGYFTITTNNKAIWAYSDTLNFGVQNYQSNLMSQSDKINIISNSIFIKKNEFLELIQKKSIDINVENKHELYLWLLNDELISIRMQYYGIWHRIINENKESKMIEIEKKVYNIEYPSSYIFDAFSSYPEELKLQNDIVNIKIYNKKNILFIVPWTIIGGADIFNKNLIKGLKEKGYKITLVVTESHEYELRQDFEEYVDEYFDLNTFLNRKDWAGFVYYLMKSRKIDLVFTSNSYYAYYLIPWLKSKFKDIPFVDYLHAEQWEWRNGGYPRDSVSITNYFDKTYVSNMNLKNIIEKDMKKGIHNSDVVYIGTEPNVFDPGKVYDGEVELKNRFKEKKVILFMCRIEYQKRPILLLNVINQISKQRDDICCIVVGQGTAKEEMIKYANKFNIQDKIVFFDYEKDVRKFYKIANIFIITSLFEGLTLTSYEALSMGVPVVSADINGQKELIDNKCGRVVKNYQNVEFDLHNFDYSFEEINGYVTAINDILNSQEYDVMKKYCREKIINRFSVNKMVETFLNKFEKLINSKSKVNPNICDNIELAERYLVIFNQMIYLEKSREKLYENIDKINNHFYEKNAILEEKIRELKESNNKLQDENKQRAEELAYISNSRGYKAVEKIRKIVGKKSR